MTRPRRATLRIWVGRGAKVGVLAAAAGAALYFLRYSPVEVEVHTVERGEIVAETLGTGTLEARVQTTIGPKIGGRIFEMLVDQGDRVEAGQLLVRLDDEELQQQVEIAAANVAAGQAALERLNVDKQRAVAVSTQGEKHHARVEKLVERNAATQDEFDKAVEALAVAQAGLAAAEAAIHEGQEELVVAEKTLKYHQARLADTRITAPFDGLIVRRRRDSGDVVVPGSSILTLISTDRLWISAWVDETEMAGLQTDQPARVVFRSERHRSYSGKIARLGREADRETREFVVDVSVLELPENWAVGQRAEVYIETARKHDAIVLPAEYVQWRDGQPGATVDDGGRARWRDVRLGIRRADAVDVLAGLAPGERVVKPVDRRTHVREGQQVAIP